jgi:hypothetical protein
MGMTMTMFQKKILFTFLPYILGFAIAYGLVSFVSWNKDAALWAFSDRVFATILGWVIGIMLYVRFEYDRVR